MAAVVGSGVVKLSVSENEDEDEEAEDEDDEDDDEDENMFENETRRLGCVGFGFCASPGAAKSIPIRFEWKCIGIDTENGGAREFRLALALGSSSLNVCETSRGGP